MTDNGTPKLYFKIGDDFKLDMTVIDPDNTTAIKNAQAVKDAQKAYDAALIASPQVPIDIVSTLATLNAAKATYDTSIIVDITGWVITSKMSWCSKHITTFVITVVDAALGLFNITAPSNVTKLWKPKKYNIDVQFERPEGIISSETFILSVERSMTND